MENVQFKCCDASLKQRATASPPNNYEPPNKFMRTDKRKLSHKKKGSRRIKPHRAFHSCCPRKMVFPIGKHHRVNHDL
ncbi:hypothetical protein QN277_005621 [Acacia crassicarpa]|nr:hypothetical protein QN277_005621 [Acacia crassicarpa]